MTAISFYAAMQWVDRATAGTVSWFPQDQAHDFYVLKGILSLVATIVYLVHMVRTWGGLKSVAQQGRYLCLLYFAVLITFASAEQVQQGVLVDYRNLGGMFGAILLLTVAIISIVHDKRVQTLN